ncbi:hypothetical protein WA158_008009 [Blastocystis sp. Blastoise]
MADQPKKVILDIQQLSVSIANNPVLHNLNLKICEGENHVILGPNGSGKSTLIKTIMGFSECVVTSGTITFLGKDITNMPMSERAKMGLGLLFQSPPEIQGLTLEHLAKACFPDCVEDDKYHRLANKTSMTSFLEREVNVGFSGGERKRSEVFQLLLQHPLLALLDEPESGVDYENVNVLGKELARLQHELHGTYKSASLTITHTGQILAWIRAEVAHILCAGTITHTGNPNVFLKHIQSSGFSAFANNTFVDYESANVNSIDTAQEPMSFSEEEEEENHVCNHSHSPNHKCCGKHRQGKRCCRSLQRGEEEEEGEGKDIDIQDLEVKAPSTLKLNVDNENTVKLNLDEDLFSAVPGQVVNTNNANKITLSVEDSDDNYGGFYRQTDQAVTIASSLQEGVEVLNLGDAIKKYPFIKEKYMWRAVDANKDEVTKAVAVNDEINPTGYVIIAHPGVKCIKPINSQLIMEQNHHQYVHNIMIAFPGSELTIASTCTFKCPNKQYDEREETTAEGGNHYGISEFYIEENAQLCFSMIHTWCHKYIVFPRSAAIVEKNGVFFSNYICLEAVNKVQMCPSALLMENATAKFSAVLLAKENCVLDVGSKSVLAGKGSKSESITRTISKGGDVYARADIIGKAADTKGHIECQGLVVNEEKGCIYSIPQISGGYGTELSHEAAIGKIAQEKIEYLMSRGLDEDTAVSLLIRGFLTLKIQGIPVDIQRQMDEVIEKAAEEGF